MNIFEHNPASCDGFWSINAAAYIPFIMNDDIIIYYINLDEPIRKLSTFFNKIYSDTFAGIDENGKTIVYESIRDNIITHIPNKKNIIFACVSLENINKLKLFPNLKFVALNFICFNDDYLRAYRQNPNIYRVISADHLTGKTEFRDLSNFWTPYIVCEKSRADFKFNDAYPRPRIMTNAKFDRVTTEWRENRYIYSGDKDICIEKI